MEMEFDVSDIAWETYRLMYAENLPMDFKIIKKNRKFILEKFKYNTIMSEEIVFSGDIDFNFTRGFAYSRLECYKKLILNSYNPQMYSEKLDLLKDLTYSIVNISLMPKTGNLQGVKQGIGNDRIDTFIWALDEYYKGNCNLLINHSSFNNIKPLQSFLNIFNGVYDYCKAIYHINETLIADMINSGKQAIDSQERVIYFMNLAVEFWRQKFYFLSNQVEMNNLSSIFAELLEEVREKLKIIV